MEIQEGQKYGAILVDTSIFEQQGLKLEQGLLANLSQFKDSNVSLLMPNVIRKEIENHLGKKIKSFQEQITKALSIASDYALLNDNSLNNIQQIYLGEDSIKQFTHSKLEEFIKNTGAKEIEHDEYIDISELLMCYFDNLPPFGSRSKKCEFPDAIVLFTVEAWAQENDCVVLAVSTDKDWEAYCKNSGNIVYLENLGDALSTINKNIHFMSADKIIKRVVSYITSDSNKEIQNEIVDYLTSIIENFIFEEDAESYLRWEPDESCATFLDFSFVDSNFNLIAYEDDILTIELNIRVKIEATGGFSLYAYDSIDREDVNLGSIYRTLTKEFESSILFTITGDFTAEDLELSIDNAELLYIPKTIHFGDLDPFSEDDYK